MCLFFNIYPWYFFVSIFVCLTFDFVASFLLLQDSLERLVRDAQMNGVRQIPRAPTKAEARPTPTPPKEEGKEEYPYR